MMDIMKDNLTFEVLLEKSCIPFFTKITKMANSIPDTSLALLCLTYLENLSKRIAEVSIMATKKHP